MTRLEQYVRRYGVNAPAVLESIALVAAAGRWGDQAKVDAERARHQERMESLP